MSSSNLTSHIAPAIPDKYYAIIVAGGTGMRMLSALPKQFMLLKGRPVLMYTIEAFYYCEVRPQIILVVGPAYHQYWERLCNEHSFNIPHQLVTGGETRFHSVKNALDVIPDNIDAVIAVQDAARPLTSTQIINESYHHAAGHGNAVTAVKSRDSVRQVKNGVSAALRRDEIYLVQTPQTFRSSQLKKAYQQPYSDKFTDDASVVEQTGIMINIIEGNFKNIKITYPEDIAIAELLMVNGS